MRLLQGRRARIEKQNWATPLLFLYSREEKWEGFGKGEIGITSDHPLVERTQLETHEVKAALSFLKEHELIEEDHNGWFELTTKGFDVAHEREMQERQLQNNTLIVLLTGILGLGAIGQLLTAIYMFTLPPKTSIVLVVVLSLIGFVLGRYS